MKNIKRMLVGSVSLLALLTLTACGEKPVEFASGETPATESHQLEVSGKITMDTLQTGWVQTKDALEVSLSGTDLCPPEIANAVKDGKVVSIHLKETTTQDCGEDLKVVYSSFDGVKGVNQVLLYEFESAEPVEMANLAVSND